MQRNSQNWHSASSSERELINEDQLHLADLLTKLYGMELERRDDGYWYVTGKATGGYKVGQKLYDSFTDPFGYGKFMYDTGGSSSYGSGSGSFKPAGTTSSSSSTSNNNASRDRAVKDIVNQMRGVSAEWRANMSASEYANLDKKQFDLVSKLNAYGVYAERHDDGKWYITGDSVHGKDGYIGRELYQMYKYHVGGIVGSAPGLEKDEVLATLQKGEVVIANKDKQKLFDIIKMTSELSGNISNNFAGSADQMFEKILSLTTGNIPENASGLSNSINFGDVYIYGANEDTVQKHKDINRKFVNEVVGYLNLKK